MEGAGMKGVNTWLYEQRKWARGSKGVYVFDDVMWATTYWSENSLWEENLVSA